MMHNSFNLSLFFQMPDRNPCQAPVDPQPLNEDALADKFKSRDFLQDTVVGGFVKGDGVLGLVFYFALGPLLLLCGFSARRRRWCFGFGLKNNVVSGTVPASSSRNTSDPNSKNKILSR